MSLSSPKDWTWFGSLQGVSQTSNREIRTNDVLPDDRNRCRQHETGHRNIMNGTLIRGTEIALFCEIPRCVTHPCHRANWCNMRALGCIFVSVLAVVPFVPAVADDSDDKEIERLVKQLGSSDFRTRDEATKRLTEIGEPALDALGRVASTLEARRRAEAISAVIETKLYGPELSLIADDLWVWSVSISVDGKHLLTSGNSATLRLWDTYTGELLCDFVE